MDLQNGWNLHRVGKKADWELTAKEKRNFWQRLAAATKGVVTPANVTSVLGVTLVGIGLWYVYVDELTLGFALITVGRIADILDGAVAQATGTKSSVGEAMDASLDKLAVIGAIVLFIATGTIPLLAVALIGIRNVINITLSLLARVHKKILHPSRAGKYAGGLEWVSILLFILSMLFARQDWGGAADATFILAYVILGLTLLIGLAAIRDYSVGATPARKDDNGRA